MVINDSQQILAVYVVVPSLLPLVVKLRLLSYQNYLLRLPLFVDILVTNRFASIRKMYSPREINLFLTILYCTELERVMPHNM